jgi:spore coat protein F
MKTISDKDIMNVLLSEYKLAATSITNLVLESADQQLRNDATAVLTKTFAHQKQIFDLMSQKGWYQVQNASAQDISRVQQEMNTAQASM